MAKSKPGQGKYDRVISWLAHPRAFKLIVGLLVIQAAWLALSGRYPMAFDEDFHLGIIRLYAHHISPFWHSQPAGADQFGAVARDPSFLYQYLMSFPYRLISLFTHNQTAQVLILRFINIGLFSWGLVLFRRLLSRAGISRPLVHACLLLLVLIPVVPLLAAQINYDNFVFPLTALALLWTLELDQALAKGRMDVWRWGRLLLLGLFTSLVKYAFLPIFLGIVLFVAFRVRQLHKGLPSLATGWRTLGRRQKAGLLVALVILVVPFGQRYGVNLVRYHTPVPDCDQVLTIRQCSEYGPWLRDYDFALANVQPAPPHARLAFTGSWLYGLWLRTFFAVDGPGTQYQTRGPLLIPGLTAILFAIAGGLALVSRLPKLWRMPHRPAFWLFGLVSVLYLAALWEDEYKAFVHTGQPVAINGRYLLPILLLLFCLVAWSVNQLLARQTRLKLVVLATAVAGLVWGGGALTYILRSNDAWYWPSTLVRQANADVRNSFGPITPGYRNPTQFLH